jgi:hypothetical protein
MYRAVIHTSIGESYRLLRPERLLGGKPLLAFLEALDGYHLYTSTQSKESETAKEIVEWFSKADQKSNKPIISLASPLLQAYYVGDYTWSEYALLSDRDYSPEGRTRAKQSFQELEERWTDIDPLLEGTKELLKLLNAAELESRWWYEPVDTLPDLETLAEVLTLAKERWAEQVIIQFR